MKRKPIWNLPLSLLALVVVAAIGALAAGIAVAQEEGGAGDVVTRVDAAV